MKKALVAITLFMAMMSTARAEWADPYLRGVEYAIVNDQDFAYGHAWCYYYKTEGEYRYNFKIFNIGNKPIDFKRAKYLGYDIQGNTYRLLFVNYSYPTDTEMKFQQNPSILNPKSMAEIECTAPENPTLLNKGLRVVLRDGRTISYVPDYKKSQESTMYNWIQRTLLIGKQKAKEFLGIK